MNVVLLTCDTDCDGTSYGAHRIAVPDTMDLTDPDTALRHARDTGQMSSYYDVADEVLLVPDFFRRYGHNLTARDRTYFAANGYTSHHIAPNWNPWAGPNGDVYRVDIRGHEALNFRFLDRLATALASVGTVTAAWARDVEDDGQWEPLSTTYSPQED